MRQNIIAAIMLALGAATATGASAAPELIFKVDHVDVKLFHNHLVVSASGAVNSGGWTNPRLRQKEMHIPESDTEVVEFIATPPRADMAVVQVLLPISATASFPLPRYGSVQVKVMTKSNSVTAPIH